MHSPATDAVLVTDLIRDAEGFDQLAAEWDDLVAASRSHTPFLRSGWLDGWRRYAARNVAMHVVTVRDRGRLIGAAPLMRIRRGFADRLEFLGTGNAGSDYLDVIVRDGEGAGAIGAIAAAIDAQQLPLYLDHLPPDSNAAAIAAELQGASWTALDSSPDVCPFIDLSGQTWDSYLDSLGSAHRANIRRRMRGLQGSFNMAFTLVDAHHDRRDAMDSLVRYSQQRWKNCGGTTAFPDSQMIAFHHAVTRRAMTEGWLRLYTLTLNGVIAAVMYGFAVDGRFFFYQHGYDDQHARLSPGLVLMALTIRSAIEEGLREFDFLYGHESYKDLWTRQHRSLARIQLFPPRITGTLLRRQAETRRALSSMAHQLGLKARQ